MSSPLRRLFCRELPKNQKRLALPEEEARHATQVLRIRNHQSIELTDGKGALIQGRLEIEGKITWVSFEKTIHNAEPFENLSPIIMEVSVLKGDAMEWVVEKCVELGVLALVPVLTDHSVIQVDKKGPDYFKERWQRIADQSLKQCERLYTMQVAAPITLDELLAQNPSPHRLVADEGLAREGGPNALELGSALQKFLPAPSFTNPLRILIGPEGGFSIKEQDWIHREAGSFVLGKLILRAETAVLASASIAANFFRDSR